ncbi:MAG: hypothetical protein ACD_3C00172G0005 [uncultured bacterium (gcode 4)]|uniref:Glyoxalase/fosfomycin resistance/dioxygenase domain-containing protein n=1 Tax=uncultured bacterium (gcode 4) TaxID=1234023 RepID=K2FXK2_9BACT|nr:MAG: hypothetical protein ACD_3C00172G0005 [uncultured bacterium (gcode 4)]
MKNAIVWFEIPSIDFDRALRFYRRIVVWEFIVEENMWMKMAFFPYERMEWVWWAIINSPNAKPTQDWTVVYLAAWDDVDGMIEKVIENWWKIVVPKTDIWKYMWFIAQFIDTEWNRVWIHGMK